MAEEINSDSLRILLGLPFMVSLFLCNNIKWNKVIEFIERIENKGKVEERYFNFINSSPQQYSSGQSIRDHLYIENRVNLDNQHILLVDDFVDSKKTFTVTTELLGETFNNVRVTPFALADTSGSD